jgi:hypothetical protein
MTQIWQRWLAIWCWIVALFGLVMACAGFEATSAPTEAFIALMHDGGAVPFDPPLRLAYAMVGALTLALAMLVAAGAGAANALGPAGAPVWRMMTLAMLVWFIIDSSVSCATGFVLNAVSNTLLMIGFLIPVLASGVLIGPIAAVPRQAG